MEQCPICQQPLAQHQPTTIDGYKFQCIRCGEYQISRNSVVEMGPIDIWRRSYLSHIVRGHTDQRRAGADLLVITTYFLEDLFRNKDRLTPKEVADNLLLNCASRLVDSGYGKWLNAGGKGDHPEENFARIGLTVSAEAEDVPFLTDNLEKLGFIQYKQPGSSPFRLTIKGWQYIAELRRSIETSRKAFMAMKFVEESDSLHHFYHDFLIPEVAKTGFALSNPLLTAPKAGNIDAIMEVEIRNSRFVIADLSHTNAGAYWEAGFAHGLGKPVFYTCIEDESIKPHFDTAHHQTVFWKIGEEVIAAERLKAMIRATLPDEAIMID